MHSLSLSNEPSQLLKIDEMNGLFLFIYFSRCTDYYVKWDGDNKTICHSMWPCRWDVVTQLFKREDTVVIADTLLDTKEQLEAFRNMTEYVLGTGGRVVSISRTKISGKEFVRNETDFFMEISPQNESVLYGFDFIDFHHPILSSRGIELFYVINCSFINNSVSYDFPMISFCNVTVVMQNVTIDNNEVNGTSILGLSTSILGFYNGTIRNNKQLSIGLSPLIEFTNAASEITNTVIENNMVPDSPLFGSWFLFILFLINSTVKNNICDKSALIVGDSVANLTLTNSSILKNRAALMHSMAMSSVNLTNSNLFLNDAGDQSIIFAPRSTINFLNYTIINNNTGSSILSTQLSEETSLTIDSTVLANNTLHDIGFALYNSYSRISNSSLISNVCNSTFLYLNSSNFNISKSTFNGNKVIRKGNIVDIINGSLRIDDSLFQNNKGDETGVFKIDINNEHYHNFHFNNASFFNNNGKIVKSIYFSNVIPSSIFEYCNFSENRFNEVNGNLNNDQVFYRCRFKQNILKLNNKKQTYQKSSFKLKPNIFFIVFTLICCMFFLMIGIFLYYYFYLGIDLNSELKIV